MEAELTADLVIRILQAEAERLRICKELRVHHLSWPFVVEKAKGFDDCLKLKQPLEKCFQCGLVSVADGTCTFCNSKAVNG